MSQPDEDAVPEAVEEGTLSIDDLARAGDVEALIELAKELREAKDLKGCLACYEAAARLGSADAEHAVGIFLMSDGVVAKDTKRAAQFFRSAADKGCLPARVQVANLYELGLQYVQDTERADVWYRSVARAAKITAAPGTEEHRRAMAELGCVRYCLAIMEDEETSEEDRVQFTRKARAYGWRDPNEPPAEPAPAVPEPAPSAPQPDANGAAEPAEKGEGTPAPQAVPKAAAPAPDAGAQEASKRRGPVVDRVAGFVAFLWASLLVGAATAAGVLGRHAARELTARTGPVLGAHPDLVVLGVSGGLALLGALLVFKVGSVAKAILPTALLAGIGWLSWHAPPARVFAEQGMQSVAFGVAGFLAALLVLGLSGGAKPRRDSPPASI